MFTTRYRLAPRWATAAAGFVFTLACGEQPAPSTDGQVADGVADIALDDAPVLHDAGAAPQCLSHGDCPLSATECQVARCLAGVCKDVGLLQGACDDGNPCTLGEACKGGACQAGANYCACAADQDCANKGGGDLCAGQLFCDTAHLPHVCALKPGSLVQCDPKDSSQCATNVCDSSSGECALQPRPDGALCNDGDPCSVGSACAGGKCAKGTANICKCEVDADCADDGDPCNGVSICDLSVLPYTCKINPGSVVSCAADKDTACRKNTCQAASGDCAMTDLADGASCDDGDPKTVNDACKSGACIGGVDLAKCAEHVDCVDDGDLCNGLPYCDKAKGLCAINPATTITCPSVSDTACVKNTCVPFTGQCAMSPLANNASCEDGDPCTKGDFCLAGDCQAGTYTCTCKSDGECADKDDGNLCNGTVFCNADSNKCEVNPATVVLCKTVSDSDCSKSACVPLTGKCTATDVESVKEIDCQDDAKPDSVCRLEVKGVDEPKAKNPPCSDADKCTEGEICSAGICGGGEFVCGCDSDADCDDEEDGNLCNGTLYCNKALFPAICKLNPATVVTCPALLNQPCQTNKCLPKIGLCQPATANEGKSCDDGDACSTADHCSAGQCQGLGKLNCNDNNACTSDSCLPLGGCKHGLANCDDGNACTIDLCNAKTGQCDLGNHAKAGTICDADGSGCTVNDSCSEGVCKVGIPVNCSLPTGPCEKAVCAPQGATSYSCFKTAIGDGGPCDDGLACTLGDVCQGGVCNAGLKQALYQADVPSAEGFDGRFRAATELADGGFALVGTAVPLPGQATQTRIWMARVDKGGQILWQHHADMPGQATEAGGVGVVAVGAGKLAFVGNNVAANGKVGMRYLLRTESGQSVADQLFMAAGADEYLSEVETFPGGSVIAVGRRQKGAARDAVIRQLSGYGQGAWVVEVNGDGDDDARGVGVAASGALLVAGSNGSLIPGRQSAMLLSLSASGSKQWLRAYGDLPTQAFEDVAWLSGGGAVAAGWREVGGVQGRWIVGLDATGGVVWQHTGADAFVPAKIVSRVGDQLVIAGTAKPNLSSSEARLLAVDGFGNLDWDRTLDVGGAGGALGLALAKGGGLLAVGRSGKPGQGAGWLLRVDPWGRHSCATAGKCAEISLSKCGDPNPCTADPCDPLAGCQSAPAPGRFCASPDKCSQRGVCTAGQCGGSDEGLLFNTTIDAGALKSVLQVAQDGDGAFISARTVDGNVALLRVDRYGKVQDKSQVKVVGAKTIAGAVPVYDGGHVTAWSEADGKVYAGRSDPVGKQIWKQLVCAPSIPKYNKGYTALMWAEWMPNCQLSEIRPMPGGSRVLVSGATQGSRAPYFFFTGYFDEKRCQWARQLDLADGKLHPVSSGGHFCGGTRAFYAGVGNGNDHTWKFSGSHGNHPVSGRTLGLSDGGLLAFGLVSQRKKAHDWKTKVATSHTGWATGFARLSLQHSEIWVRELPCAAEDRVNDVALLGDGSFLAGGYRSADGAQKDWLISLSAKGDLLWQRTGRIGSQARLRSLHVGAGGTVVVVADAVYAGFGRTLLSILDTSASVLSQRFLGPAGVAATTALFQPVARLPDFGLLIAGSVASAGKAAVLVVRANPWGHDSCKAAGACAVKTVVDCDDGDPCLADLCDAKKGCVVAKWSCDDDEACTTDLCDPKAGCSHGKEGCDDKDACTTDVCVQGKGCEHAPVSCVDGNTCTTDSCHKAKGCQYALQPDSATCVTGPCTVGACKSGLCAGVQTLNKPGCADETASPSCKELLAQDPQRPDGVYWLDPDGKSGPIVPFRAVCDMSNNGGGWTLLLKSTGNCVFQYKSEHWEEATTLAPDDLTTQVGNAKYPAYNELPLNALRASWPSLPHTMTVPTAQMTALQRFSTPQSLPWNSSQWYNGWPYEAGYNAYGLNLSCAGGHGVRWGWLMNNDKTCGSNDAGAGIGMACNLKVGAGGWATCCANKPTGAYPAAVQIWGR